MDPPGMRDVWGDRTAQWQVACHWLGPLIDGRASLIRRATLTDGGSIPRLAWPIVGHPFMMPHLPAYLQHDGEFGAEAFSREICDERLRRTLELCRVDEAQVRLIYDAVRVGGGECWDAHTPESIDYYRSRIRIVGEELWHALDSSRIFPGELFASTNLVLA